MLSDALSLGAKLAASQCVASQPSDVAATLRTNIIRPPAPPGATCGDDAIFMPVLMMSPAWRATPAALIVRVCVCGRARRRPNNSLETKAVVRQLAASLAACVRAIGSRAAGSISY